MTRIRHGRFTDLDPATLYQLLRLRVDAFVVEQRCAYPELDGRDLEPETVHWWVEEEGQVLACLRVLAEPGVNGGAASSIGRVVTAPQGRGRGLAGRLLSAALATCPRPVALHAQAHLAALYARHGFVRDAPDDVEDGIAHTWMRLDAHASVAADPDALVAGVSGEPRLLGWARRLAAVAQNGLAYHDANDFEGVRYTEVRAVATELMTAAFTGSEPATVAAVLSGDEGYTTPKIDVRAVVVRDGQVLFVREVADGGWTLPGGWADTDDVPSAAIEREVREEAGLAVRATRLLAVLDRTRHGHTPRFPFRVWKLLVLCAQLDPSAEPAPDLHETSEVGWFALDDPDLRACLSAGRTVPGQLDLIAAHLDHPARPADFD